MRNYKRAVELANKFQGIAINFENYIEAANKADIVITSTGAPHYMIRTKDVVRLMQQREGRPLIFY